jgi:hypothetical protein
MRSSHRILRMSTPRGDQRMEGLAAGGERPEFDGCPGNAGRRFSRTSRTRLTSNGAVRGHATFTFRRRRRRAPAVWSERFFPRLCVGDWALAGRLPAQRSPLRANITAGTADRGELSASARLGTANNSAGNSVHINRAKCRRLSLQTLGLMLQEIPLAVTGASSASPVSLPHSGSKSHKFRRRLPISRKLLLRGGKVTPSLTYLTEILGGWLSGNGSGQTGKLP